VDFTVQHLRNVSQCIVRRRGLVSGYAMLADKSIGDDLVIVGAIASSDLENEILDFVVRETCLPLQGGKHVGTGRRHRFGVTQRCLSVM